MKDFSISVNIAICLPSPDVEALIQGRSIFAISRSFISSANRKFAVSPIDGALVDLPIEKIYKENFLPRAILAKELFSTKSIPLLLAEVESSQVITNSEELDRLSENSVWTRDFLEEVLSSRGRLFLNLLRAYKPESSLGFTEKVSSSKVGSFVKLQTSLTAKLTDSILSEFQFSQKKIWFQESKESLFTDIEALQSEVERHSKKPSEPNLLDLDLRTFIGWQKSTPRLIQSQDWFEKIALYGYREDETTDNKKSNYQAGTDFEIIIRQSLEFLGFTVDESHAGGAGGIDVFCSYPYDLVGECKCGKGIPDSTVEQLARIAKRHLKERYETANRFIIGPGNPSLQLLESAKLPTTSIMNPETLQKLVEFHNKYPINLFKFREKCLIAGQIDDKVDDFLGEINSQVKLRSEIVRSVKALKEQGDEHVNASTVRTRFNTLSLPQERLDTDETTHDLLIELSSPLTGYLGRTKGITWLSDRFYFLRDLIV